MSFLPSRPSLIRKTALVVASLTLSGCGQGPPDSKRPAATGGAPAAGGAKGMGGASELLDSEPRARLMKANADELFEAKEIPIFHVSMDEERWKLLNENPGEELYVEGALTFNDVEMGPVGFRYKGSSGSLRGCLTDGRLNPAICNKLGVKLKFDKYDKDQRLFGMKRLNLHSLARDSSKMRDVISYKLFREGGINAPRASWARLEVNGENMGLYGMVEQIDGRFTADRWPEGGDGNLYKEQWPISDDPDDYARALKTNEDTAHVDPFVSFRNELYSANDEDLLQTLGTWMDLDQLYLYLAIDETINNGDGFTAFYCSERRGDVCENHNFYVYQHESDTQFSLIPWDLDYTLLIPTTFEEVPRWIDPGDCGGERFPVWLGVAVESAGCDPVFRALRSDRARYVAAMDVVLNQLFDPERIREEMDGYAEFIRKEMEQDPTINGTQQWMNGVQRLKNNLENLKTRAEVFREEAR